MKNLFRTKNDNQLILIDVEKETQNFTKAEIKNATEKGRDVASNHPPTTSEGLQKSPVAIIIRSSYTSKLVEYGVLFSKKIEFFRTQYQQLLEAFKADSDYQNAQKELTDLKEEAANSLDEAVLQHEASIEDKRDENKDLRADIKNNNMTLRGMKKHLLWPLYLVESVILSLIVIGEISLSSESMEFSGLSQSKAFWVGISIATASFVLGIFLATVVRNKKWQKSTKILVSILLICLAAGLFYTLGSIRASMLSETGINEGLFNLTPWHFALINLCFFFAIVFVKYVIFPSPEKVQNNADYKGLESKNHKLNLKLQSNEQEIQNAHHLKENAKKKVKANFKKPLEEAQAKIDKKIEEISLVVRHHNAVLSRGTLFYRLINADFKTVTATFYNTVNLYRKDQVNVNTPSIPDLEDPFKNFRSIKTFEEIETVFDTTQNHQTAKTNKPQNEAEKTETTQTPSDTTEEKPFKPNPLSETSIPSDYHWNSSDNATYKFNNSKS